MTFCPIIKGECREDCAFNKGKCILAEFMESEIQKAELAKKFCEVVENKNETEHSEAVKKHDGMVI